MMSKSSQEQEWQELTFTSQDGLSLYARHYPAATDDDRQKGRPLVCLAGLTRNSKDFHKLALHLSRSTLAPRDVYCLDYRGRGKSDYDTNWENYSPYIEMLDTLDFMSVTELHDTAVLGTSRGGIIAMLMGVTRPGSIGTVIFNDIGPVIESRGLARIIGYVGKTPAPRDWDDAALIVRDMTSRFFTDVKDDEWLEIARQWYMEDENGDPVQGYDIELANTLSEIDLSKPIPEMWEQFSTLYRVPALVIRGENSDLLSAGTVEEMSSRHPDLQTWLVREEGHAPLLRDRRSKRVIDNFLAETDNR